MNPLIAVETDLEPDDVFALYLLHKGFRFHHVVVGEGDADIKVARARQYLQLLGSDATVVRGHCSDKQFDQDGKEFADLTVEAPPTPTPDAYVTTLRRYISSTTDPIIVLLKPPRELMESAKILKDDLKTVTLYLYGGFNLRCLLGVHAPDEITTMLSAFKEVQIYESFHAVGVDNTINRQTDPTLHLIMLYMASKDPYIATLLTLNELWNRSLMADCHKTCEGLLKGPVTEIFAEMDSPDPKAVIRKAGIKEDRQVEKFYRNWKAYSSIHGHETFQFVMADMCAVTAFLSDRFSRYRHPAEVTIDPVGYTKFTPKPSTVSYYQGIPREKMIEEMIRILVA